MKSDFTLSKSKSYAIVRTFLVFGVFSPVLGCNKKHNLNDSVKSTQNGVEFNFSTYVDACEKALGPIPKLDCSEIDEVVIWTRDALGAPVRVTDEDLSGKSMRFQKGMNCANPSLAGPPEARCMPFARIGASAGVKLVEVAGVSVVCCERAGPI